MALPGVKAAVTSAELPQPAGRAADLGEGALVNPKFMSNNCLAGDKALYVGHAVAAVVATDPHVAEEALSPLSLIDVEYDVLPPVLDVLDAMKDDAPVFHERLASMSTPTIRAGGLRSEDDTEKGSNVANHILFKLGDPEQGFREAAVVVEREFRTVPVHQGYIEPHSATALWGPDGTLTIWCSSQGHFQIRQHTATILGIPLSRIRVIPMEIGGGFGGKLVPLLEPVASLLSGKTGHPVKMTMSRSEVFEASRPTSGAYLKVKMGATNEGRITAADAYMVYEAGAFPGSPVPGAANCIFGPYDIPNSRIEGFDVVLNRPKTAAYRAPGAPSAAFATETVVDEICQVLGMDPLKLPHRQRRPGWHPARATGQRFPRISCLETLRAAQEHPHYSAPLEGPNRGRGVAAGFWTNNTGPSSATASVNPDGTVSLVEGSSDIGGSRAVAAMHVAEVLGIPAEDVKPAIGDTDSVGFTSTTGGSGVAFKTGWACYEAAQDVRSQMIQRAARVWDVPADDVEYADGVLSHASDSELRLTFRELAGMLNSTGGPIVGRANVDPLVEWGPPSPSTSWTSR